MSELQDSFDFNVCTLLVGCRTLIQVSIDHISSILHTSDLSALPGDLVQYRLALDYMDARMKEFVMMQACMGDIEHNCHAAQSDRMREE